MPEVKVGRLDELADPGCREFSIGEGDWPFRGFVVRQGSAVFAYQNYCVHAGHPLNLKPNEFLTASSDAIICSSHGAMFDVASGECFAGPCKGKALRTVKVELRDGVVFVDGPSSA